MPATAAFFCANRRANTLAGNSARVTAKSPSASARKPVSSEDILRRQVLAIGPPPDGAVEAGAGLVCVAQLLMGHRQEEQVEGVGLAVAGGEAFFQGRDRLRMMTRAIEGDAQRVEINRLPLRQPDGVAGVFEGLGRVS